MKRNHRTDHRLAASIVVIVVLSLCLAITSFALVYASVPVEDNVFLTGAVKIDLNGARPIISETGRVFEPGMTLKREFYIKNESTCDVYYKLYFENVVGGLGDILEVIVTHGEKVLYQGTVKEMSRMNVAAADDVLKLGETRQLQILFHFPEMAGNALQGQHLAFDFAAEAVQTKNNADKEFD